MTLSYKVWSLEPVLLINVQFRIVVDFMYE